MKKLVSIFYGFILFVCVACQPISLQERKTQSSIPLPELSANKIYTKTIDWLEAKKSRIYLRDKNKGCIRARIIVSYQTINSVEYVESIMIVHAKQKAVEISYIPLEIIRNGNRENFYGWPELTWAQNSLKANTQKYISFLKGETTKKSIVAQPFSSSFVFQKSVHRSEPWGNVGRFFYAKFYGNVYVDILRRFKRKKVQLLCDSKDNRVELIFTDNVTRVLVSFDETNLSQLRRGVDKYFKWEKKAVLKKVKFEKVIMKVPAEISWKLKSKPYYENIDRKAAVTLTFFSQNVKTHQLMLSFGEVHAAHNRYLDYSPRDIYLFKTGAEHFKKYITNDYIKKAIVKEEKKKNFIDKEFTFILKDKQKI